MPMQPVTLRRWEIGLAFVLLTLAFVFAIFLVNRESRHRSAANKDLIVKIQVSRAETTYTSCLEQNARHDRTVDQLDALLLKRKAQLRKDIRETTDLRIQEALRATIDTLDTSRTATVSLIEALAPLQNCDQLVLDRFGFIPMIGDGDG